MDNNTDIFIEIKEGFECENRKRLKTCIPLVKVYSNIAFPLSILGCEEKTKEWFFSNFINVYSKYNRITNCLETRYDVQFFEDNIYYLNRENISIRTLDILSTSIIDSLISIIQKDIYIAIFLDEYYVEFSPYFHKKHIEHETLLIGYDIDSRYFYCLSYGSDEHYRYRTLEFTTFIKSYTSNSLDRKLPIMLFSYHDENYRPEYKMDVSYIYRMIENYMNGKNFFVDRKKLNNIDDDMENVYGINIYDNYYRYIKTTIERNLKLNSKNVINLIPFYFIYEHKECMKRRIQYLGEREQKCINFGANYNYVVNKTKDILNMVIKYNIKQFGNMVECNNYLKEMLYNIEEVQYLEKKVLSQIVINKN